MASVVGILIALWVLVSTPAVAQTFSVKRVTLGGSWTEAGGPRSLNSRGPLVGTGELPGGGGTTAAFMFDGSTFVNLGVHWFDKATAINESDQVAGSV